MKHLHYPLLVALAALILLPLRAMADIVPTNKNIYVKATATGNGNGSDWNNATASLSEALIYTNAQAKDPIESKADEPLTYTIHIAQGTYYPQSFEGIKKEGTSGPEPGPRDHTFLITSDVTILGGYKADGSGYRNPAAYPTILSGDLSQGGKFPDNAPAYHVVLAVGKDIDNPIHPSLDGVTITGGNSLEVKNTAVNVNGYAIYQNNGAGLYNYSADIHLRQVVITGNQSGHNGGGILNQRCTPTLTSVRITANQASSNGGGMYNTLSSPTLTSVWITANQSSDNGGGIYNSSSSPQLISVEITGNQANVGSGIYNDNSSPTLTQVTLAGNKANSSGGGIYNIFSSRPKLRNSVVWGNTAPFGANVSNNNNPAPTYTYCLVQGLTPEGEGNLPGDTQPGFVAPIVPGDNWTPTAGGDYRLQSTSPLINQGSNDLYPGDEGFDLYTDRDAAGNPRLYGERIDIGAYEDQTPEPTYHSLTLDIAPGIDCYGLTAGTHRVAEGDHLFLQFLADDPALTAEDLMLVIDGIDTPFNVPAGNAYYGYILPVTGAHTILIAQRYYPVTLPRGFNLAEGVHSVAYGEPFVFSTWAINEGTLKVYANGEQLPCSVDQHPLRTDLPEVDPVQLFYLVEKVIGPVMITTEGEAQQPTGHASLATGKIRVAITNYELRITNEMTTAVDVAVYTVTGQTFVQLRALSGSKTIALPAGVYFIRAGSQTWKMVVD
ncbi:choice-of-anchor Q domain-containing protein [Parabacteroides sp. PF5-6]|uniref:choice-of-anchor Q domain-containing protein n=1 Tax=Parabacteroides sp. PF5-6 TaxID=1742403 RepID=UPI0024065A18|nr:choice-of-anchor Q domain-containing protein [Parabacteroides sp. PF5-6]MDF9831494.1 hypothetical protein [Parabacteroides sp. PF5-6]